MDSMKKLKLFPDGWYRNMTKEELAESRQQLKAYTVSSTLDKSIKEVICFNFQVDRQRRRRRRFLGDLELQGRTAFLTPGKRPQGRGGGLVFASL
jgi:hypothetical protein